MDKMLHITVVDDEPAVGIIYKAMLRNEINDKTYIFKFFTSASDYLKYLETADICEKNSVLISDINMPEIDGFSLLTTILDKYPNMDKYVSSAITSEEYREKGKKLKVLGFFDKPVDFRTVKETFSIKYKALLNI